MEIDFTLSEVLSDGPRIHTGQRDVDSVTAWYRDEHAVGACRRQHRQEVGGRREQGQRCGGLEAPSRCVFGLHDDQIAEGT